MTHYAYLAVLAGCLALTLPLEVLLGARVYRRARDLALVALPVACLYSLIDVAAVAAGLWHYSVRYTVGLTLPGALPVEEVAFFFVVPICAVLTYESVGAVLVRARTRRA